LLRHYIRGLYRGEIHIRLTAEGGQIVNRIWDVERCPYPGCNYFHFLHPSVETHIKTHKDLFANVKLLGWFWGSIRTILQKNPQATIRDVMGEGPVLACPAPGCRKIFCKKPNLVIHHAQEHTGANMRTADIEPRRMYQALTFGGEQGATIPRQEPGGEADQRPREDEEVVREGQSEGRRVRTRPNPLQIAPDRQEVESQHMSDYKERRREDFRRKLEEHRRNTSRGVNVPQMSRAEMRKVKEGLAELFKTVINPMMK
jgi:hypothetical protein